VYDVPRFGQQRAQPPIVIAEVHTAADPHLHAVCRTCFIGNWFEHNLAKLGRQTRRRDRRDFPPSASLSRHFMGEQAVVRDYV
jgi:hypothetical protein